MPRFAAFAAYSLGLAGILELVTAVLNLMNLVSVLLGVLAIAAAAFALWRGTFGWPAWTMAIAGSVLGIRVLTYSASPVGLVALVGATALFLAAVLLAFRARGEAEATPEPPLVV